MSRIHKYCLLLAFLLCSAFHYHLHGQQKNRIWISSISEKVPDITYEKYQDNIYSLKYSAYEKVERKSLKQIISLKGDSVFLINGNKTAAIQTLREGKIINLTYYPPGIYEGRRPDPIYEGQLKKNVQLKEIVKLNSTNTNFLHFHQARKSRLNFEDDIFIDIRDNHILSIREDYVVNEYEMMEGGKAAHKAKDILKNNVYTKSLHYEYIIEGNHLFLGVVDKLYHFHKRNKSGEYVGEYYQYNNKAKKIEHKKVTATLSKPLKYQQWIELSKKLTGKWESRIDLSHTQTYTSYKKALTDNPLIFQLELKADGSFILKRGFEKNTQRTALSKTKKIEGKWSLGLTGDLINLTTIYGTERMYFETDSAEQLSTQFKTKTSNGGSSTFLKFKLTRQP